VLQLEPFHPGQPVRPPQLDPGGVGQRREVVRVRLTRGGEAAGLGQLLKGVLADGVEQVIAPSTIWERRREDRLVNQRAQQLGHPGRIQLAPSGGGDRR
jgi:hypothetical protein